MILIIGGEYHGKLSFIKNHFLEAEIVNLQVNPDNFKTSKVLNNFHELSVVYNDFQQFCQTNIELLKNKVIIGKEVGYGIVPLTKELRTKRDRIGRAYQMLTKEAAVVIRIWYGIPIYLKGNEEILLEFIKKINREDKDE